MTDLLLDSHVLIWSMAGDPRLPARVAVAIEDGENRLFVSMASVWEIGIKLAQGRLRLPGGGLDTVFEFMREGRMVLLPITVEHVRAASMLPFHHGDPFDRMLIAQANITGCRLMSKDAKMRLYPVDILW